MNRFIKVIVGITMTSFAITVASVLTGSYIVYKRGENTNSKSPVMTINSTTGTSQGLPTSSSPSVTTVTLTSAEVSRHNNAQECWMIIDGNVYNFTPFLQNHPGGIATMTPYCGKDGTLAFNTKDKNPASKHSKLATSMLPQYLLGVFGNAIAQADAGTKALALLPTPTPYRINGILVPTPTVSRGNTTATIIQTSSGLNTSDVAPHNTIVNCWLIISGNVYNVTSYLVLHPGGVGVIQPYCGKDATVAFATKDKNPASGHSAYAQSLLPSYKVGTLSSGSVSLVIPTPTPLPPGVPTPTYRPVPTPTFAPGVPTPTPIPAQQTLTTAQVATHNTTSNCWLIISTKVYDVTSYLAQHPGGIPVVSPFCGHEATNAFATKGGNGSTHSAYAYSLLNNYLIGTLGQVIVPTATPIPPTPTPTLPPGVPTPTRTPTPQPTAIPTPIPQGQTYTAAQVATHNTTSNCWLIISNKVYNVTSYLVSHPGGINVVKPYCGNEATNAFATKGGNGGNHSQTAYNLLNNYLVGTLSSGVQPTATPVPPTSTPVPGAPTATPAPAATNTPVPTATPVSGSCTGNMPAAVCSKYPGSSLRSGEYNGSSWEGEINTSGGTCRHLKTNSSGSITSDSSC